MGRKHYTPTEIAEIVHYANNYGAMAAQESYGATNASIYRWQLEFSGMNAQEIGQAKTKRRQKIREERQKANGVEVYLKDVGEARRPKQTYLNREPVLMELPFSRTGYDAIRAAEDEKALLALRCAMSVLDEAKGFLCQLQEQLNNKSTKP